MRYGYYSYFKPFVTCLTDGNRLVKIEIEEIHQYNDDESEDVFFCLGYSEDQNEYLRRFIELPVRIEINDQNFEEKAFKVLKQHGFEPLF